MNLRYDILYLRFISIISIILYHFNTQLLKGGYLGVDILLILTGYLNINSLSKSFKERKFSYINFILRKSKRLVASSLLVVYFFRNHIYDYLEICCTLIFTLNIYFYKKNIDYFHQYDEPSPILHYWCLSLEYQFYFIIPFLKIFKYANYIICIAILISLFILINSMKNDLSYCYYCFLPRLYQFLFPNFISAKYNEIENRIICILFTLLYIFFAFWCRNEYVYFHLPFTIYICLILNYNILNYRRFNSLIFFSRISYSIYLIHYPIIILYENAFLFKFGEIVILSIIFYYLCEKYLYYILDKINDFYIIIAYLLIICYVFSCYMTSTKKKKKAKYNSKTLWKDFCSYRISCSHTQYNVACDVLLLIGDSHIDQWIAGLHTHFLKNNILLYYILLSGFIDIPLFRIEKIIAKVEVIKNIKAIILCNFKYGLEFKKTVIYNFDKYYIELQKRLLNYSDNIVILNDNPHLFDRAYRCLNNKNANECYCILGVNCTICDLPVYAHKKVKKCDMNRYLCKKKKCPYIISNRIVYVDAHHLTPYITKYLSKYLISCINLYINNKKKCYINNTDCKFYDV